MTVDMIIVIGGALAFAALTWLALIGGSTYSVEDAMAHSADYAGVIEEGHGRMTVFLWVTFGSMLGWTVYYLVDHWEEFRTAFG